MKQWIHKLKKFHNKRKHIFLRYHFQILNTNAIYYDLIVKQNISSNIILPQYTVALNFQI